MSKISIGFDCHQDRIMHGGKWVCRMGDDLANEVVANTKAELKTAVIERIHSMMHEPKVVMAAVGVDCRVIVEHGGNTTTYKPVRDGDGVVPLRETGSSSYSAQEDADRSAQCLFQDAWCPHSRFAFEVPKGMPESRVSEYKAWVGFQARHRGAQCLPEG